MTSLSLKLVVPGGAVGGSLGLVGGDELAGLNSGGEIELLLFGRSTVLVIGDGFPICSFFGGDFALVRRPRLAKKPAARLALPLLGVITLLLVLLTFFNDAAPG